MPSLIKLAKFGQTYSLQKCSIGLIQLKNFPNTIVSYEKCKQAVRLTNAAADPGWAQLTEGFFPHAS